MPLQAILSPQRLALAQQFLRFGSVGFVGFLFDNAVVYGLRGQIGLYAAGAVAYLVSATVTWTLNRLWTFRGRGSGPLHRQWFAFLAANALGFVLNRGMFAILVTVSTTCAEYPVLAVFAGTLAGMFVNFQMSRTLVFR